MLNILLTIDKQITQFLNTIIPHNSFFNWIFSFISFSNGIIIWIILALILIIIEETHHKKFIFYLIICTGLAYLINEFGLKNIFMRSRPLFPIPYTLSPFSCPTDFSFPSTHAAFAFSAATVFAFFHKKKKWFIFYYFIAALISYSRIYLGCHYLMDVVAGGLIGYLISKIILKFTFLPRKT